MANTSNIEDKIVVLLERLEQVEEKNRFLEGEMLRSQEEIVQLKKSKFETTTRLEKQIKEFEKFKAKSTEVAQDPTEHGESVHNFDALKKQVEKLSSWYFGLDEKMDSVIKKVDFAMDKLNATSCSLDKTTNTCDGTSDKFDDISRELKDISDRLDVTTSKLDDTTNKTNKTSDELEKIYNKLDRILENVKQTSDRLDGTTDNLDMISDHLNTTSDTLDELSKRVDVTLVRVKKNSDEIVKTGDKLDEMSVKLDSASDKLNDTHANLETSMDNVIRYKEKLEKLHLLFNRLHISIQDRTDAAQKENGLKGEIKRVEALVTSLQQQLKRQIDQQNNDNPQPLSKPPQDKRMSSSDSDEDYVQTLYSPKVSEALRRRPSQNNLEMRKSELFKW